jgi:hypothetical protein
MTATRVFLAGILGGIVMFIWSSIGHDVLGLGEVGVQEIPNEQPVLAALQSSIGDKPGFYFFPGLGLGDNPSSDARKQAMQHMNEKMAANPSGILIYHPPGRQFQLGKLLGVEFVTELIAALLAVFLLAQTRISSFAGRVGFVLVTGILVAIMTNVQYWNWYGFPGNYTAAYMLTEVVGFLCAGIVAALVLPKPT